MGRRRKFHSNRYGKGVRGKVSHDKKDLIGEYYGEVNKSGDVYVDKDLKGYKTVTYVFKEEEKETDKEPDNEQ